MTQKTRLEKLELKKNGTSKLIATQGLDGIYTVNGERLTEAEFREKFKEDEENIIVIKVGFDTGKI